MEMMPDGLSFVRRVKNGFQDEPEKFHEISTLLGEFESQIISPVTVSQRAKEILENHPQLIEGLNEFLPEEFKINTLSEDREQGDGKGNRRRQALDFLRKVKERYIPSSFMDYLSILRKYKEEELGRSEVCRQLFTFFSGDPELVEELSSLIGEKQSFLHEKEDMDLDTAEGRSSFVLRLKEGCIPFNQIKEKLRLDNYEVFLKIIYWYNAGEVSIENLAQLVIELMEQCSEEEKEVKRKRQIAASMCEYKNEVEDKKFELDMMKAWVKSTANTVKSLLDGIFVAERGHPEETLTAIHMTCIERLYGEHGLEIMEELAQNQHAVLPVIYERLKQKQEELEKQSSICDQKWAKYLAEKYHQITSRRKRRRIW